MKDSKKLGLVPLGSVSAETRGGMGFNGENPATITTRTLTP